jgi:hypothetical protein
MLTMAAGSGDTENPQRREDGHTSLRDAAWEAAQELYRDQNCRWFRISDLLPIYGFLCDFARGKPLDPRAERIAARSIQVLKSTVIRIERDARVELPPEWEDAKKSLSKAEETFLAITQPHLTFR